ncbi:MAG: helix-turn-helix transcriptional regulator [Synergistaceae bacterium]|nr:helix-turn-helix transcriptional regulator [Synergistaceae bacterium]
MTRHARDIPEYVLDNLDKLKQEREKHSLTQARVAEALGGTVGTLQRYENDAAMPDRRIYNRLARIFSWEVWKLD